MAYEPVKFINEPIEVHYDFPQIMDKRPECPQSFSWNCKLYVIVAMISEWHDYRRKGRRARNMQPQHLEVAKSRGSWGVGVFYFLVRTQSGEIYEIYYDRSPQDADRRKGSWFIYRQLVEIA